MKLGQAIIVHTGVAYNGSHLHLGLVTRIWSDFPTAGTGPAMVNIMLLPDCGTPTPMASVKVHASQPAVAVINEGWLA